MTIDDELRRASDDLRRELRTINPPPLDRSTGQHRAGAGGRLVLVMASLAVFVVGGLALTSGDQDENDPLGTAGLDATPTDDQPADAAPTEDEPDAGDPATGDPATGDLATGDPTIDGADIDGPVLAETTFTDPTTGTPLTAVETREVAGSAVLPLPGGSPTWNADGTLLLLYEVGIGEGGHAIYDGGSLERIRGLDISPVDIEQVSWDPAEPSRLFYVTGNELIAHDVTTDQANVAYRFEGCDVVTTAGVARPIANDGRRFGFLCEQGADAELLALDLETGTEARRPVDPGTEGAAPLPDGTGYVAVSATGMVEVYNTDLEPTGSSFVAGTDQFVLIETVDGRQLYVTTVFVQPEEAIGSVVGFDLATGEPVVAIGEAAGDPYPPSGTRLAASVTGRGQVVVSIVGDVGAVEPTSLDGKVFLVDFDPAEPTVTQVADHRAGIDIAGVNSYWTAPHPGIHPDGATVVFAGGLVEGQITTLVAGPSSNGTS